MRRAADLMLRCASLLVPGGDRAEWLAEWRAELWHVRQGRLGFCLGAFPDAMWLRRNAPRGQTEPRAVVDLPAACIGVLAGLAAASVFVAVAFAGPRAAAMGMRRPLAVHVGVLFVSLVILASTTSLELGDYPGGRRRRWWFLATKLALLLPIVICGTADAIAVIGAGIQPHAWIVGHVAAFRWAIRDQRRRCPDCLRRVTHPARIGAASQTFLEWYGTELACPRGHGLLHVSEIPTSVYGRQRWQELDSSWSVCFSRATESQ